MRHFVIIITYFAFFINQSISQSNEIFVANYSNHENLCYSLEKKDVLINNNGSIIEKSTKKLYNLEVIDSNDTSCRMNLILYNSQTNEVDEINIYSILENKILQLNLLENGSIDTIFNFKKHYDDMVGENKSIPEIERFNYDYVKTFLEIDLMSKLSFINTIPINFEDTIWNEYYSSVSKRKVKVATSTQRNQNNSFKVFFNYYYDIKDSINDQKINCIFDREMGIVKGYTFFRESRKNNSIQIYEEILKLVSYK